MLADNLAQSSILPSSQPDHFPWYALRTRANHEWTTTTALTAKGFHTYVPTYQVKKRWSDRTAETEIPLFPGYVFCRFDAKRRVPILSTPGVASIVGFGIEAAPIPEEEIESVRCLLRSGLNASPHPFLAEGQSIRIDKGPLSGIFGILVKRKSDWRFVVSVPMLQRSVSVEVDAYSISVA